VPLFTANAVYWEKYLYLKNELDASGFKGRKVIVWTTRK
jgi:hypothetical protein